MTMAGSYQVGQPFCRDFLLRTGLCRCSCHAENYQQMNHDSFHADKLCFTTKYLSEVSKKVSGFPDLSTSGRFATKGRKKR